MSAYLIEIELPVATDEIEKVIPDHRKHIHQLFGNGKLLSYSVSVNKDHIWCVLNAENEKEAMDIVAEFPLRKFFVDVFCYPLLYHNIVPTAAQGISLN